MSIIQAHDSEFYQRDAEARERGRLRAIAKQFAEATGIPLTDLAAALLAHLAEPVAEIVATVIDERGRP